MKKLYISAAFVLLSMNLFSQNVYLLMHDFRQKHDLRKRYAAIEKLSKMKNMEIFKEFMIYLIGNRRNNPEPESQLVGIRAEIAKNLKYYAGVPYDQIKTDISHLMTSMAFSLDFDTNGYLVLSIATILNNNGPESQKVYFVNRLREVLLTVRKKTEANQEFRARENEFVKYAIQALATMKHKKSLELLLMMLELRYANYLEAQIKAAVKTYN